MQHSAAVRFAAIGFALLPCSGFVSGCNAILGIDDLTEMDVSGAVDEDGGAKDAGSEHKPGAAEDEGPFGPGSKPNKDVDQGGDGEELPMDAGSKLAQDAGETAPEDAASNDPAIDAGAVCGSARWPENRPSPEAGTGGDIEFVVAIRRLDLGDRQTPQGLSYRTTGYDLDRDCSVEGPGGGTCGPPPLPMLDRDPTAEPLPSSRDDGIDGVDNAMGLFFAQTRDLLGYSASEGYNELIDQGYATVLARIRGYNGTDSDDNVDVAFFTPAPRLLGAGPQPVPPVWDGSDLWPILSDNFKPKLLDGGVTFDPEQPQVVSNTAYVADGILFASVPNATLRMPSAVIEPPGQMVFRLSGAVVTGRPVQVDGRWQIQDGIVAGRWALEDVLSQLSQFPSRVDTTGKTPLCRNSADYQRWKQMLCASPDIHVSFASRADPCNALSAALGFHAEAAQLGPVFPAAQPPQRCAPEHDPATDTCDF